MGIHIFESIIFPSYKIAFSVKTESIIFCKSFKLTVEDGLTKLSFFEIWNFGNLLPHSSRFTFKGTTFLRNSWYLPQKLMLLTQTVSSCYTVRDMLERRFLRRYYGYHCHFVFPVSIKRIIINTKVIILVSRTVTDKRLFSAEIIIIWANNEIHSITG